MKIWRKACSAMLVLGAAPLSGACGFHPVYGDASVRSVGPAMASMAIESIPERSGQLLRQELQRRLNPTGRPSAPLYTLRTTFRISTDPIAIAPDSTVTRVRLVGYSEYSVVGQIPGRGTVTSGTARALDGYDEIDQQFFAGDLANEAVVRRLAGAVADQIALQLGWYFAHAEQGGQT